MQSQTGLVGSITEILTRRTRRLQPADGSRNHGHSLVRVFDHLAEGLTNREIGARLGLSRHTIKNYLLKIFDKLGVSNRVELLSLTLSQAVPRDPISTRQN